MWKSKGRVSEATADIGTGGPANALDLVLPLERFEMRNVLTPGFRDCHQEYLFQSQTARGRTIDSVRTWFLLGVIYWSLASLSSAKDFARGETVRMRPGEPLHLVILSLRLAIGFLLIHATMSARASKRLVMEEQEQQQQQQHRQTCGSSVLSSPTSNLSSPVSAGEYSSSGDASSDSDTRTSSSGESRSVSSTSPQLPLRKSPAHKKQRHKQSDLVAVIASAAPLGHGAPERAAAVRAEEHQKRQRQLRQLGPPVSPSASTTTWIGVTTHGSARKIFAWLFSYKLWMPRHALSPIESTQQCLILITTKAMLFQFSLMISEYLFQKCLQHPKHPSATDCGLLPPFTDSPTLLYSPVIVFGDIYFSSGAVLFHIMMREGEWFFGILAVWWIVMSVFLLYEQIFTVNGALTYVGLRLLITGFLLFAMRMSEMARRRAFVLGELRNASAELVKQRTRFLARVSHEIRTPLNVMILGQRLMLDTALSEEQRTILTMAEQSGDVVLAMLRDTLDLAALDEGGLVLKPHRVEVRALFDISPLYALARSHDLRLRVSISSRCPDSVVVDSTRVSQVVWNLTANALKYTERGRVTVRVDPAWLSGEIIWHGERCEALLVRVLDTGPGIPEELSESLFDRFKRGINTSTADSKGGVGLGLSIAKELTLLWDGRIGCCNRTDRRGACFWFTVPVDPVFVESVPLIEQQRLAFRHALRFVAAAAAGTCLDNVSGLDDDICSERVKASPFVVRNKKSSRLDKQQRRRRETSSPVSAKDTHRFAEGKPVPRKTAALCRKFLDSSGACRSFASYQSGNEETSSTDTSSGEHTHQSSDEETSSIDTGSGEHTYQSSCEETSAGAMQYNTYERIGKAARDISRHSRDKQAWHSRQLQHKAHADEHWYQGAVPVCTPRLSTSAPETVVAQQSPPEPKASTNAIMVVDDNTGNRRMLELYLSRVSVANVLLAVDGIDCFRQWKLNRDKIRLILMDHHMPRCDGVEAVKNIRAVESRLGRTVRPSCDLVFLTPSLSVWREPVALFEEENNQTDTQEGEGARARYGVVVICVTASSSARDISGEYRAAGFDGVLSKPFHRDAVEAAIFRFCPELLRLCVSARTKQQSEDF